MSIPIVLLVAACAPADRVLHAGRYRAVIEVPVGELPFALEITRDARGYGAALLDADRRIALQAVAVQTGRWSASLPGAAGSLTASVADGELRGTITLATGGTTRTFPLRARLGQSWQFFAQPLTDNIDVAGRWSINRTGDRGDTQRGVGEFRQRFEAVSGSVQLPASAPVDLRGEVHGEELRLARFDGAAAVLYHLHATAHGDLQGESWSLRDGHARVHAARNADAVLPDPADDATTHPPP